MENRRRLYRYDPDYAVPPGPTLQETIEAIGMSQTELALRTGRTLKTINEIIKGKAPITAETAIQLERVLRVPASFWNNLERNYRADLASIEERNRFESSMAWARQFPHQALAKLGAISSVEGKAALVIEMLNFFGIASPSAWERTWTEAGVAFRRSPAFQSSPGSVSAWLRLGEIFAQKIPCQPYDRPRFRLAISSARSLTVKPIDFAQSELARLCAEAGVAVVFVPELPKTHVSGATRWLSPTKALIQLSLRHKTDDHLWFCFFHEAGHILLHGKKAVFLEEKCDGDNAEMAANEFARDTLIPPGRYRGFTASGSLSRTAIQQFAESIGIAPGIVVGRLQRDDLLDFSVCNDLKQRYVMQAQGEWAV
jgi:HTH-type transcriptional regulator / antitoxin HigA